MTLSYSLPLGGSVSLRHKRGIMSRRQQSMRDKSMKLIHAACDPMTLSSVMCLSAFYA